MKIIEQNNLVVAVVENDSPQITSAQSALDLLMEAQYGFGCSRLAVPKEALPEDFFVLSTGLAGEILQKFINYHGKIAVYGDFSHYRSKPLRDFIYESNKGKDVFFVSTREEAVKRLFEAN